VFLVSVAPACNDLWGIDSLDFDAPAAGGSNATGTAGAPQGGSGGAGGTGGSGLGVGGGGGDAGAPIVCQAGQSEPCYDGAAGTEGVGLCHGGTRVCNPAGTAFGPCDGQVLPATEICNNVIDEACDGPGGGGCLVDTGLIVRYFIAEASSGQAPTALVDVAPSPLPMPISYTNNLDYAQVGGHLGLSWLAAGSSGTVAVAAAGTKIAQALTASKTATIEVVAQIAAATGNPLARLGHPTLGSQFSVLVTTMTGVEVLFGGGQNCGSWPVNFSAGRQVLHAVLDTSQPTVATRLQVYVNGTLVAPSASTTCPAADQGLDPSQSTYSIGSRTDSAASIQGTIFYAALYSAALTPAEVATNATLLLVNDDH